jgi:hypothetical protein
VLAILVIKTITISSISFINFIFAHGKHKQAFLRSVQLQIASRPPFQMISKVISPISSHGALKNEKLVSCHSRGGSGSLDSF